MEHKRSLLCLKSSPPVPIIRRMNPIHIQADYLLEIHF
jgi:hypothetical protein